MKKFFKGLLLSVVALVCVFTFSACKTPISATSADVSKVGTSNGMTTNGGITAIYGDYLYFVNGTKTNDGTSSTGNTRGAICRVKYNKETGEVNDKTYEVVVSDLAGFQNCSLYFFGDYMYYTTPSGDVNYKDNVLNNKTKFMRYDLVNKVSYNIYTTKQNSSSESISFAYYINGKDLNLVVFEKSNATLTSIKIDEEPKTNYVIKNVTSCVLSESYGKAETGEVDANSFVFYTTSNKDYDKYQTGVQVYRTSPFSNNSVCLSNEGLSISLLCIRAGKLLFSLDSKIYCQPVDANLNKLETESYSNVISYGTYDDVVFIKNDDGSVSVLYYETKNYQVVILNWDYNDGVEIKSKTICALEKFSNFSFIGLVTLEEDVKVPSTETTAEEGEGSDEEKEQEETTVKRRVTYVTYVADNYAYKLEIMREDDSKQMQISVNTKPVKLSTTKVQDVNGMLIPEVVGNYFYAFVNELDKDNKETGKIYLYRFEMTLKENATSNDKPTFIGIVEK